MLVVIRFDPSDELTEAAQRALASLSVCVGFKRGWWGRSVDEPTTWTLVTEWESVGAYRRALSSYDVKLNATPLLYQARDEVTAFETVLTAGPGGAIVEGRVDLASDAGSAQIGDFGPRQRRGSDS